MSLNIFDVVYDKVIRSTVGIGKTNYQYALERLFPLVDRLESQRNPLSGRLYKKMEKDIIDGAILPPITVAFVTQEDVAQTVEGVSRYVDQHIGEGFILDGIQRLSALKRIHEMGTLIPVGIHWDTTLYINVVISPSSDNLLYRMITLNNGQKPMSPRHQIEALTDFSINFTDTNIRMFTEKAGNKTDNAERAYKKSLIVKSYISFMSKNYQIDNAKIIETKMDELLVDRILTNQKDPHEKEFSQILQLVGRFSALPGLYAWFSVENNMIGFASAIRNSYAIISNENPEEFFRSITNLETYMSQWLDKSKIKMGTERRRAVHNFITNYAEYKELEASQLVDLLSEE